MLLHPNVFLSGVNEQIKALLLSLTLLEHQAIDLQIASFQQKQVVFIFHNVLPALTPNFIAALNNQEFGHEGWCEGVRLQFF